MSKHADDPNHPNPVEDYEVTRSLPLSTISRLYSALEDARDNCSDIMRGLKDSKHDRILKASYQDECDELNQLLCTLNEAAS